MNTRLGLALFSVALVSAQTLSAETLAGLPLHVERLNPKTVRVWVGDHVSSTATVAFATQQGVVVIDTLGIPVVDLELRKVIARELGRSDFKYLINTHEHGDHTLGNGVYADCTIVAHELCAPGMKASFTNPQPLDRYATRIKELEADIAQRPANAPELPRLREELVFDKLNQGVLAARATPTYPTRTFGENLTLNMGDTTFELYYAGGMHSASDISIFVPEHGLLMTGDTMADAWLTGIPGCLASFVVRTGIHHDFPLLLKNWGTLLAKKEQIKRLVPGHWNGTLSLKGFEDRCAYIKTLWEGIRESVKEDKPVETLFRDFPLRSRFPQLVNSPGITPQNHASTLLGIWCDLTGKESASQRMLALVRTGAPAKAIQELLAERDKPSSKYYFLEGEFNYAGYELLQENQAEQALALFRANADLHPRSWNAFDSLAEAHLRTGNPAQAIVNYEKSLTLNPENKNGRDALAKLRGETPK